MQEGGLFGLVKPKCVVKFVYKHMVDIDLIPKLLYLRLARQYRKLSGCHGTVT